jgi:hypothetical protein
VDWLTQTLQEGLCGQKSFGSTLAWNVLKTCRTWISIKVAWWKQNSEVGHAETSRYHKRNRFWQLCATYPPSPLTSLNMLWYFLCSVYLQRLVSTFSVSPIQCSVVGIATSYGLDDRGVRVRVPVGSRIFTSPDRPDRL